MGSFDETLKGVENFMNKRSLAGYSFENRYLAEKNNYTKILYMKILCVLAQYGGQVGNAHIGHLERIIEGCGYNEDLESHMRKALEFSLEEFKEFLNLLKEDDLKYYFCIDGLILLSAEQSQEKSEFLAKIVEAFEITVEELKFLSAVSSASIEQSSRRFDEAKEMIVDSVRNLDCGCYVKNFYTGMIIDNDEIKYYYSADGSAMDFNMDYHRKKVIFENVLLNITDDINFMECEEVYFRNCKMNFNVGCPGIISVEGVGLLEVSDSEIKGTIGMAVNVFMSNTDAIHLYNNSILECGAETEFCSTGGLICFDMDSGCYEMEVIGNNFKNCYACCGRGLLLDSCDEELDDSVKIESLIFKDNKFTNCRRGITDEDRTGPVTVISNLYIGRFISEGNQLMPGMRELYNCEIG